RRTRRLGHRAGHGGAHHRDHLENFGEGLGTAVFMVYLMRCCAPEHKAAHMAILTALMSVSFTVAGVGSGFVADALGLWRYFALSFAATIPGMLLVLTIPHLAGREALTDEGG